MFLFIIIYCIGIGLLQFTKIALISQTIYKNKWKKALLFLQKNINSFGRKRFFNYICSVLLK
jgi:hypothetical protein